MSDAIKWTPELLAEVRNEKGVVFGKMSVDARRAIISAMICGKELVFDGSEWIGNATGELLACQAYCLRPDWTPPELQEKPWVDVPVFVNERNMLMFKSPINPAYDFTIECAQAGKSFMGYVYADGTLDDRARRMGNGTAPCESPVAVRFWTGSEAAK